jgi:hypothetical protein
MLDTLKATPSAHWTADATAPEARARYDAVFLRPLSNHRMKPTRSACRPLLRACDENLQANHLLNPLPGARKGSFCIPRAHAAQSRTAQASAA